MPRRAPGGAPALPWKAVGLSALLGAAAAGLILPAVARQTGGWVVRGDGVAYFLYARALVLEGSADPTAGYRQLAARLPPDPDGPLAALRFTVQPAAAGRIVLPWPIGAGLLMAPFYALGWGAELLAAGAAGRAPDSFGLLPQVVYGGGAVAYGVLGFWCCYQTCRRVAAPWAATAATAALVFASPAAFYLFLHPAMAHAPSFGLAALLVLVWWRAWTAARRGSPAATGGLLEAAALGNFLAAAALGGLAGLLVLVRYQNVVFALLPLALLVLLARRRGVGTALGAAAAMALAAALPLALAAAPLLRSGGALPGGGGATGLTLAQNRFDLASPHLADVLLSCQHGAFYWTPVLALGTAALAWAALRHGWARAQAAVLAASVYLIGCLTGGTNWSGDNAYGMRYLVESVPLLAPALAWALAAGPRAVPAEWKPAALEEWESASPAAPAAPTRGLRAWQAAGTMLLLLLISANGLLMLAFARRTIPHDRCVPWSAMAAGMARALRPGPTTPGASEGAAR